LTLQGTIQWGQNNVAVVDSADAFNDLITRLEAEAQLRPIMIDVIAGDGRSLALGIGRDKTVLSLVGAKGSPPYYASVGDENAQGDISFDYGGQGTDFRLRHAVPISAARTAAVQFLSGSGLPDAVRWEEV
jgi:immunity protein Imm1 of predicted polymorphic toxin system